MLTRLVNKATLPTKLPSCCCCCSSSSQTRTPSFNAVNQSPSSWFAPILADCGPPRWCGIGTSVVNWLSDTSSSWGCKFPPYRHRLRVRAGKVEGIWMGSRAFCSGDDVAFPLWGSSHQSPQRREILNAHRNWVVSTISPLLQHTLLYRRMRCSPSNMCAHLEFPLSESAFPVPCGAFSVLTSQPFFLCTLLFLQKYPKHPRQSVNSFTKISVRIKSASGPCFEKWPSPKYSTRSGDKEIARNLHFPKKKKKNREFI